MGGFGHRGQGLRQLYKILCPFIQRWLKVNSEQTLLPKHKMILYMGMSAMQKRLYCNVLQPDVDVLRSKDKSSHGGGGGNRTEVLNIVMQLRKCAGHPYLFLGAENWSMLPLGEHLLENCCKRVLLDKLLQQLKVNISWSLRH